MVGGAVAPLAIGHASTDPRFAGHPGLALYGIESYIAVPLIRRDGSYFGTLCALDPRPADLTEDDVDIFRLLADLIAFELEADEQERGRELELAAAREEAELRERFIAMLGHDLRTPITAIKGFVETLTRRGSLVGADARRLDWIATSADRMGQMIADLLDFTRGRLGGGIPVEPDSADLARVCRQVVQELAAAHSDRRVALGVAGDATGRWDGTRLGQVVANLLANALQYSPPGSPVEVGVRGERDRVVLTVHNQGPPVPPAVRATIFDPFRRGRSDAGGEHLGLGLYIVQQIVLAHRGKIDLRSSEGDGTTFEVSLPRD